MEIAATNKIDTENLDKSCEPKVVIKATAEEVKVLRDAADVCDKLRIAFLNLEIFDPKIPEIAYENLLELADLIEDHKMGEKCNA